jgi:hypothetical protein
MAKAKSVLPFFLGFPLILLVASACTLDNERKEVNVLLPAGPGSISLRLEPECGSPARTSDSLTRDSLFYTDYDYSTTKTVYRKQVAAGLLSGMRDLLDSLRIDSLNGLNVSQELCGGTADCRTHEVIRVRGSWVSEFSDTRRCVSYDPAYLKAFAAYRNALAGLRN